ncbi:GNAT family N-acetyltransferase [Candidatus Pseudothioglobus singularis]|nr:GNAT family N-acetyltransferase [Candidatus Pseudothioglobus singularis]
MADSKKVTIDNFNIENINAEYLSWLNDHDVTRYSELRHVKQDYKSAAEYISRVYELNNKIFSILAANGEHIGNITLRFDNYNLNVDFSILIGNKDYWGKGYARYALNEVLDWLRQDTNMKYITAGTMKLNIPMIKVFKSLGFDLDGARKNYFKFGNSRVDLLLFKKEI